MSSSLITLLTLNTSRPSLLYAFHFSYPFFFFSFLPQRPQIAGQDLISIFLRSCLSTANKNGSITLKTSCPSLKLLNPPPLSLVLLLRLPLMRSSSCAQLVCICDSPFQCLNFPLFSNILLPLLPISTPTVVLRLVENEFKQAARTRRFIVRDYSPRAEGEDAQARLASLSRKREEMRSDLIVWCRVSFFLLSPPSFLFSFFLSFFSFFLFF